MASRAGQVDVVSKAPTSVEGLSAGCAHHNARRYAEAPVGPNNLAVVRNRRRARFDAFLASCSASFAGTTGSDTGEAISLWLRKLARLVRVDCISLWEWQLDAPLVHPRFAYSSCGSEPMELPVTTCTYPWLAQQYRNG